jgi:hypothetical protein
VVGTEKAGGTAINVLMVVCKCNEVYRYQITDDSNRNYPASGREMDSNLLQDPSPLSNVAKFGNSG